MHVDQNSNGKDKICKKKTTDSTARLLRLNTWPHVLGRWVHDVTFFSEYLKIIKSTKNIVDCVENIKSYLAVQTKLTSGIK